MQFAFDGNATEIGGCDALFGPAIGGCGDKRFDFTLLFEQSLLSIGPAALLLLAFPLRTWYLARQGRKAGPGALRFLKICLYLVLGVFEIGILLQWLHVPAQGTLKNVSIAASSLGVVVAPALAVLSYMEHGRSVKPSTVLCFYLFFSVLFDAVQCRTLWLLEGRTPLTTLFAAVLACKVLAFVLEVKEKRGLLLQTWKPLSLEATAGIVSKAFFWWLNEFLIRGFRTTLSIANLGATDPELHSELLLKRISNQWEKRKGNGKYPFLWAVLHANKAIVLSGIFPRLCEMAFGMNQPFFVNRVIRYVGGEKGVHPQSTGYALIAAAALLYSGNTIARGFAQHKVYRLSTVARGSIISLVLDRTVDLKEGASAGSAALTLINADVNRITESLSTIYELWASPTEILIAMWLLYRQVGAGCVGPIITVIICSVLTTRLAQHMGPASKTWNEAIQKRVTVTTTVMGSMKETKMLGMVDFWTGKLQGLRNDELVLSKKFRMMITFMNVLGNFPAKAAAPMTFGIALIAAHFGIGSGLSLAEAFTSLTIIGLIVGPLSRLVTTVPRFSQSLGSIERIQEYLEKGDGISKQEEDVQDNYTDSPPERADGRAGQPRTSQSGVFVAENVDISTTPDEEPLLKDVNLNLLPRSFTIITGKVGSGKSVLLRGLLGELHSSGHLQTSRTGAAYCAQTTWLTNSSVRDNILGQASMEHDWYSTVVQACALDMDFDQLPQGDLSLIGSKGISLSGGQKQRVALARALYARKPVMLVDDVLSGLDWTTQRHIWTKVFGSAGICRQHRVTTVLATHVLKFVGDDDDIILIGNDRHIAFQGRFGSLKDNPDLSSLLPKHHSSSSSEADDDESSDESEAAEKPKPAAAKDDDEQIKMIRASGEASLYGYYLKSIGWIYCLIMVLIAMGMTILNISSDFWLKIWTDPNDHRIAGSDGFYFGIYVALAVGVLFFVGLCVGWMFVVIVPRSASHLHWTLLKAVMRFSKDMTMIDQQLPVDVFVTVFDIFHSIGAGVLVMYGATYIITTLPFILMFLYLLARFYLRTSRQVRALDLEATAPLYSHLLETIEGVATIRAFGWQRAFRNESMRLLDDAQKPHYMMFCIQRWLDIVLGFFVTAIAVIVVTFGVLAPETTSAGAIALSLVNVINFGGTMSGLIVAWTSLDTSIGVIARLRDFESSTPSETPPEKPEDPPKAWPSKGQLDVEAISASYATETDTKLALDNISLHIKPGEKVAISGRTGSGKSTFLLSLFRLLDPQKGVILVDGVDISRVPQNVVRSRLIAVPQDPVLFPGSLRSNLLAYEDAAAPPTDQQMDHALKRVELWDAVALRGGLDADISDLALSHGQKQLLCLARAILRKDSTKIVALDEAMSAVDHHTEELMMRVLAEEFADHTVISVVHRLNTIQDFDTVVVLDQGKAVEIGNPQELLREEGGRFRALWNGQDQKN